MTGEAIAGLLIKFGPIAFDWIKKLVGVWKKEMTPDEVESLIKGFHSEYEDYIKEAGGRPEEK